VWAVGCLLYELLTGEFLFYDDDWIRFFIRVTSDGAGEILPPERMEPLRSIQGGTHIMDFLANVFIRDPQLRPSIHDIAKRCASLNIIPLIFCLHEPKACSIYHDSSHTRGA
jgi:serine/threonine protein kinase